MDRIRIRSQTGRPEPASPVYRALSTANRLANLVRGDVVARRLPVDVPFCLETFTQRSRYLVPPGQQSISRKTTALRPRAAVSLPLRVVGRKGVVETRTNQRMAPRAIG